MVDERLPPSLKVAWRVVTASVQGSSHEKLQIPCQDASRFETLSGGLLIAAVADGAGSAVFGEVGAQVATDAAISTMRDQLSDMAILQQDDAWRSLLIEAMHNAKVATDMEAASRQVEPRELATTLIVAIASLDQIAVAQVGDGATVVATSDESLAIITRPQVGEYANETFFITSQNALEIAECPIWHGPVKHLAIFTDGMQRLALQMPEAVPFPGFFSPVFRFLEKANNEVEATKELVQFLTSSRVRDRTDDDLTLMLATLIG